MLLNLLLNLPSVTIIEYGEHEIQQQVQAEEEETAEEDGVPITHFVEWK